MLLGEQYKLELHWKKVEYVNNTTCLFKGACFSGPVLSIAEKINSNEFITLDFTKQYYMLVSNYYVAKLSWEDVVYVDNEVRLKNVKLLYDYYLEDVPVLKDNDYLVIDTKGHELGEHHFNLVYYTYVIDRDGVLYNFRGE